MKVKIIDSTLRDGEQKAGIALSIEKKVQIARLLDSIGVDQIESGTPAMGGEEIESIKRITQIGLRAKISSWNRMDENDLICAMACATDVIHISVPVSGIQIESKLKKSERWVKDSLKDCVNFVRSKGFIVNVGMEDASRGDINFIKEICSIAAGAGAAMVRYADTVGLSSPISIKRTFIDLKNATDIPLGFHGHNDLGMALANTLAAACKGASYVDCTVGGIGERAGNCNLSDFVYQSERYDLETNITKKWAMLQKTEKEILGLLYSSG